MRTLPPDLASHLGEGTTTLCRCWRLTRRDGTVLGFTDHDRDLVVGGLLHVAASGLEAAEATAELGFAIGGGEIAGALSSDSIDEADVAAGLYDDATVEVRLVDWAKPATSLLLAIGSIGEIRRRDDAFVAELRGPLHRFDEERGLTFRATCSADLGDSRCRVGLATPAYGATATVLATDGALRFTAPGLVGYDDRWFTAGRVTWLAGAANAGLTAEVKRHRLDLAGASIELWQRAARPIAPGDPFGVTAGCDKRLSTCRDKFANVPNFRGFPHMPGNDFVLKVAAAGEAGLDGGSLFR